MQPTTIRLPQVISDCMAQIFDIRSGRGVVTIKWVVSIIGLLVLSVSYAYSPGPPPEVQEYHANLERWRSHGITNYRMRFQMDYFCCDMNGYRRAGRSMLVDVRKGLVHSAVYEDNGKLVPVRVFHSEEVHSIDSLIISMEKSRPSILHGDYHAEYGYPEFIAFKPDYFAGREFHYRIELLKTMQEDVDVNEMISIPAGTFRMGDLSGVGNDDEKPAHSVSVPAFKLGKYEVTYALWDACVADGGCDDSEPYYEGWARGNQPVINVSWDDVQYFIAWLNAKTGGNFRLPSEAEWEYAARAGSTMEYSWGDDIGSNRANCNECGNPWDILRTTLVGTFPANAWGLHDMHGNVSEWVQDCYNDSYDGAPTDGSAWASGDCSRRVLRGGSWFDNARVLHSAFRWGPRSYRDDNIGFRLAQDE